MKTTTKYSFFPRTGRMAPSRACACKLYMTVSSFNQILKGRFCATESMERVLQHLGLHIYLERKGNSPFPSSEGGGGGGMAPSRVCACKLYMTLSSPAPPYAGRSKREFWDRTNVSKKKYE